MPLLRLAAFVLFLAGAAGAWGWPFEWSPLRVLASVALGLACWVASGVSIPQPPSLK
jgi:hypothetical protein